MFRCLTLGQVPNLDPGLRRFSARLERGKVARLERVKLATPFHSAAQQVELQKLDMARSSQGGKKDNKLLLFFLENACTMRVLFAKARYDTLFSG